MSFSNPLYNFTQLYTKFPMQQIIYENINSDFGYGTFLDLRVVIMKKNGYINATKMCKLFDRKLQC